MAEAFEFSQGVRYTHRMCIPWWRTDTNLGYIFNLSIVNLIFCTIIKYYSVGVFYVDGFIAMQILLSPLPFYK